MILKNYNQKSKTINFDNFIFEIYNSIMPYEQGLEIMNDILYGILHNKQKQKILFLEHEDVYSAGRMVVDSSEILNQNIKIQYTDRGGRLTYHGPGQRIIYPILDLSYFQKDIRNYVIFLQNLVINILYNIGINAHIDRAGIGVWTIQDNDLYKIASIGIKVKKWIAYHGIAINIFNDLTKFDAIIPCGIKDYKHISIKKLGIDISFKEFDQIFIEEFNKLYSLASEI
jgi:lipoyl(octanoyl) transferase